MKTKKFKSGLIALIIILVLVIGFVVFAILNPFENVEIAGRKGGKKFIATVYVQGTIEEANYSYNQEWLLSTIEKLKNNDRNAALVLFIDSPGGAVYQADEVYLALQKYKASGKKLYAYMGSMAASGGYYIACAADTICANRNTLTGSIGVIAGQSFDFTDLFDNLGIKSETIHAGKNKNMGNYNEPLSDEQREILQSVADECYEQFVSIVANQRDLSYDEVCNLADGRVYTAKQALNNGLIDRIDTFENFMEHVEEECEAEVSVREYKYEKEPSLFNFPLRGELKSNSFTLYW